MKARKAFANLGAASVSRLGSAAMTFVLFWWLARKLPPAELGAFALMTSVFALLQLMPLLGLHVPLAREVSLRPENLRACVHIHGWFAGPVALLIALVLAVYGHLSRGGELAWPFWLLALSMLPTAWTTVAEATLIGLERMRDIASINLLEAAWRLIGSALAVAFDGTLTAVMAVFLIGRCVAALLYLRLAELPAPQWRRPPQRGDWAALWASVPVFLGIAVLASLNSRLDVLGLSHLVSLDQLGQYAAGAKLYEAAMMVPSLATMVVLPPLARLFREDSGRFARVLPKALRLLLAVGLPLALMGAALAPHAIVLLFPARFVGSTPVVQVLLFAAVFATLDLLLSSVMLASHAQRQDLQALVAGLAMLALGIAILVPLVGPIGAAVSVSLHMVVRVLWRARWISRVFKLHGVARLFVGAFMALAAGAGALTATMRYGSTAAALAALVAYGLAAWAGGLVRRTDLAMLGRLMPRPRVPKTS